MIPEVPYLPTEDVRKVHAEINQLNNQRFLICLAGITFFGAFGWALFPKSLSITPAQINIALLNTVLLQVILGILCAKSQILRMKGKFLAAYLAVTGSSVWEVDLATSKGSTGTAKYCSLESTSLSITFITLGAIPFCITFWMGTRLNDNSGVWFVFKAVVAFALLIAWVLVVNHSRWCNKTLEELAHKWHNVLKHNPRWQDYSRRKSVSMIPFDGRGNSDLIPTNDGGLGI